MSNAPLTIAWFSQFPVEWLPDAPDPVKRLPREHPLSWQRVLLDELENVPSIRLHVIVLRKQFEKDLIFERKGVTFHLIKTPGGLRAPTLFWLDTWLIRRKMREIKPDVVHAWGTERGGALVARRLGYPAVTTIQGLLSWYEEVMPLNWHDRLAAMLERYSLPKSHVVTTESTFSTNWLRQRFPRLRIEQVEHAPAGLFHRVRRQPQTKPLRFLFVGTFDYRKGGDILLLALDGLKDELDFELLVVGSSAPNFMKKLRRQSSDKLWRRIQFKQNLLPSEIAQELARTTMMIFPTRADTSPNSVKEAVVAGVPVIASSVGGITDYVFHGENGFLFPAEDTDKCLEVLRQACRHPLFSCGAVKPETLQRVREYLSPELMGQKFIKLYELTRLQCRRK